MSPARRLLAASLAAVLLLVGASTAADAREDYGSTPGDPLPAAGWPEVIVDLFAKLPVQDAGRVKPLNTWATYALLRANFRRSCETPDDRKIEGVEWVLDALFRPELARTYRCFMVENREVVEAIGVEVAGRKKRDRYAYDELAPGRERLVALADEYLRSKKRSALTVVEAGIVALRDAVEEFEGLLFFLDFARSPVPLPDDAEVRTLFDGAETAPLSEVARRTEAWIRSALGARGDEPAAFDTRVRKARDLARTAARHARGSTMLELMAPTPAQVAEIASLRTANVFKAIHPESWLSPTDVVHRAAFFPRLTPSPVHAAMLEDLETLTDASTFLSLEGPAADTQRQRFMDAAYAFHGRSRELAEGLGLYDKIELEVYFLRLAPFSIAKYLFVVAFLLVALTWIVRNRWLDAGIWAVLLAATAVVVYGIVLRCIVRDRPPVSTLYETIIFIAAVSVGALLVTEWLTRKRIALALAPLLGYLLLLAAVGFEELEKKDTMPQLLAVLDTNFWLTVHVLTIVIGYAASLATAAVAHVYVLGKAFGFRKGDHAFYDGAYRITYGLCAFAVIFSTVGTITGGIWANDSWGRFWGWDPKENGALMIVLWQLGMFHMRLGGYIKGFGFSMAAIALATVVSFSWWGVNLLGYGLHSYGFTAGVSTWLYIFYGAEVAALLAGAGWRFGWPWYATAGVVTATLSLGAWLLSGSAMLALVVLLFCMGVGLFTGLLWFLFHVWSASRAATETT